MSSPSGLLTRQSSPCIQTNSLAAAMQRIADSICPRRCTSPIRQRSADPHLHARNGSAFRRSSDHRHGRPSCRSDRGPRRLPEVTLVTSAGPVACRAAAAGGVSWAEFTTSKAPTETPFNADLNQLAAMMGIAPSMIGGGGRQPSIFGTGLDIVFVPVISIDALRRGSGCETLSHWNMRYRRHCPVCSPHIHPISAGPLMTGPPSCGSTAATGGAAAAIGGVFARFSDLPDGDHHVEIHQGHEIGRPSVITLDFTIRHGRSEPARIGGRAVIVQEGWLRYPGAFSQHSEPV